MHGQAWSGGDEAGEEGDEVGAAEEAPIAAAVFALLAGALPEPASTPAEAACEETAPLSGLAAPLPLPLYRPHMAG